MASYPTRSAAIPGSAQPQHCVVIGGSIAGLLAARVLSDTFDLVTVLDRDQLPARSEHRRGVPQGHHAHGLMPAGSTVLESLFPGLLSEWEDQGVPVVRQPSEMIFAPAGIALSADGRYRRAKDTYQPSRPVLEAAIRGRVRSLENVEIRDQTECTGLQFDESGTHVIGTRLLQHPNQAETLTAADLVVDATGRTGRAPIWLKEAGYPPPPESRLDVDILYVSTELLIPGGLAGGQKALVLGAERHRPTGATFIQHENDRWMLTLFGYGQHHPPTDRENWLAFAQEILPDDTYDVVRSATFTAPLKAHRFPASVRRHYERLRQFPSGLLVFGDAVCSFNPVYGQGMSVAALQARALQSCLNRGPLETLPRRFYRASARPIDIAHRMAVNGDLALPAVNGPRPRSVRWANAYITALMRAAQTDPTLTATFVEASSLLSSPAALVSPVTLARVARGALLGRHRMPNMATNGRRYGDAAGAQGPIPTSKGHSGTPSGS